MKQSKLMRKAIVLALALGMVGCAFQPTQISTPAPVQSAAKISGTLRINVTWPNRNYNTASLPDSTNKVVIAVKKTTGEVTETVGSKTVLRTGNDPVSTSLKIQAGSGYSIDVIGYRTESGIDTPVAHGAASGVNVKSGRVTTVPSIEMAGLNVPVITNALNADGWPVAKVGDTITLQGENLGAEATLSLDIALNGTAIPAGNISRVGTGSIQVVIPDGSTCGTMSVKVDNVAAVTNNPLWIIDSVSLPATASIVNHSPFTLLPTIGWVLKAGDTAGKFGTTPDPLYSLDTAFGTVAGNVFSPNATSFGPVTITPKMGSLVGGSIAVTVLPKINSVSLNPSAATINATSDGSEPTSGHPSTVSLVATVYGDDYNTGVTWSSSNAELATVNASGLVTANNNSATGSVTITATSKDNSEKFAQATITITGKGVVEVGVE